MISTEIGVAVNFLTDHRIGFDVEGFVRLVLRLVRIRAGFFEFSFVDNTAIRQIHQDYLNDASETDVITFDLSTPQQMIGDVYISAEQAQIQANDYHQSFDNELKLLIIHSILHLMGYDDQTDELREVMEAEQKRILSLAQKKGLLPSIRPHSLFTSFLFAFRGIAFVIDMERNMKVHLILGALAVLMAAVLGLTPTEWLFLIVSISMVMMMECINTAVEISVDLTTKKRKYRAMLSKDIAAGAVLVASLNAVVVGMILFLPKIIILVKGG